MRLVDLTVTEKLSRFALLFSSLFFKPCWIPMKAEDDDSSPSSHYQKEARLYCNLTDLHGWQYFNLRGKSRIYQCTWGLVIFTSIVTASVILTYAFLEYIEDAVQTTYDPNL